VLEREDEEMMKITYFLRDDGPCGYYRASLPMETLRANSSVSVGRIKKGDDANEIERNLDADVFLIPRAGDANMLRMMGRFQSMGKRCVVDFDDDEFNISPFNPRYRDVGIEEVTVRVNDEPDMKLWEDGRNIDIKANKVKREDLILCCQRADTITVTTDILAEAYKPFNDDVRILPNCIDPSVWQKLPFRERDTIRIGWTGGASHYEDLCLLQEVLPKIMNKYENVELVLFGEKFDGMLKDLPKERIEYHPWVDISAYPYKLAALDLDIMLVPIVDNAFNRRKSPIKWMEASMLGIPCVMSNVSPYRDVQSEDNGIYIEDNHPDSWIKGISYLINNPEARESMSFASTLVVMDKFNIEKQYKKWAEVYEVPQLEVV
jgi:glycosyltransferase involved in cell wall biosynthesis